MVEIELSKEEAESLVRTLRWVMTACKMTEEDEIEMKEIISKLEGCSAISPSEAHRLL